MSKKRKKVPSKKLQQRNAVIHSEFREDLQHWAKANRSVENLNELEYVNGKIYANIIPTNRIAIIENATPIIFLAVVLFEKKILQLLEVHQKDFNCSHFKS